VRTDLALLNFGGPQSAEEVEPFLYSLFVDPDLIKLPFPSLLQERFAGLISSRRAPKIAPHYKHIGYSPLVKTSREQAAALGEKLADLDTKIWLGMRYTEPSIPNMVREIAQNPPDRLIALALYPHFSITTTGSTFNILSEELKSAGLEDIPIHYIPAFYAHPQYNAAMKQLIENTMQDLDENAHVLFSAHGVPVSYYKDLKDPYPDQIKASTRLMVETLELKHSYSLSFQSRVGPVRWLGPSTEEEIIRLSKESVRDIVVVPMSFTTEGIETLYEIDIEFGEVAERFGVKLRRAPTIDTHPQFIECLNDIVRTALQDKSHQGLGQHQCVRCLLPKPQAHRTRVECIECGFRTPEYLLRLPSILRMREKENHSSS
jgi:protoporphyrin/coproporphyrin ferrochelatase